jgi:hypothetical protein
MPSSSRPQRSTSRRRPSRRARRTQRLSACARTQPPPPLSESRSGQGLCGTVTKRQSAGVVVGLASRSLPSSRSMQAACGKHFRSLGGEAGSTSGSSACRSWGATAGATPPCRRSVATHACELLAVARRRSAGEFARCSSRFVPNNRLVAVNQDGESLTRAEAPVVSRPIRLRERDQ